VTQATRAAAIGIGALAALSAGQWVRAQQLVDAGPLRVALGVLPNFTAAIAIPFVALGAWLEMRPTDASSAIRRRFVALNLASLAGLLAWEFLQRTGSTLRFDPDDLVATVAGAAVAHLVFVSTLRR
jgi:hypothetical protein